MTSDDWVAGIADEVRRLALAGVSDGVLQAFIDARRRGDTELAASLLSLAAHRSPPTAPAMTALERLRVAALRPVVNSLDAHALYAYVSILWPLTDHASRNAVDPRSWESAAFVETLAHGLMHAALEQLQPGIVGPDGQLRRH
ncbi:MAG: hypothetical protein JSR43_01930 [Proteobacteria bacterium]|nr:hypothetical protein [Pseudomonadota bacterium]